MCLTLLCELTNMNHRYRHLATVVFSDQSRGQVFAQSGGEIEHYALRGALGAIEQLLQSFWPLSRYLF